jgi:uncharacterized protein (DUF1501 family)
MARTRREFIRDGAAAFVVSFAAPAFLSDVARAQGARSRNLVVVYLGGGNDSLNTVVPYQDPYYYSRRPTIAVPAGQVLQIGQDSSGRQLGLHPRLSGLHGIYNEGRLAIVQRTGYTSSSRSHFQGLDIWSTGKPSEPTTTGWLGRYLETVQPRHGLCGWCTTREVPRALLSRELSVPGISDARAYRFESPNGVAEGLNERRAATRIASHVAVDRPQLAFVNGAATSTFETLDMVAQVAAYVPTVAYPVNDNGFGFALQTVAGSIVRNTGTRVYWVQTGGYDTHASQGAQGGAFYGNLMGIFNNGLTAFYNDLRNHGLLGDTLVLQFSEFGRRIAENGSAGTDHGAAAVMMAMGGPVRGGIYGTAASLNNTDSSNTTLESNGGDVRHETDFRAVYARVLDGWLGASSTAILGGDFRSGSPPIV